MVLEQFLRILLLFLMKIFNILSSEGKIVLYSLTVLGKRLIPLLTSIKIWVNFTIHNKKAQGELKKPVGLFNALFKQFIV